MPSPHKLHLVQRERSVTHTVSETVTRTPLNVIVADDDDSTREILVNAIRQLGHHCRGAVDGLEAWQLHEREHADVILSDWQMPRMDGLELCRRTRGASGHPGYTYFIFLTSFADKEHLLGGMNAGADDYHTKPVDLDELQARLISAGRVVALYKELAVKNAVLRRDSQTSFRVARTDALTEIGNRLSLDEDLKGLWSRAKRYRRPCSLVICDVDHFKDYNDRFGHVAGDDVLRSIAKTLRQQVRTGDSVYRYGGEEFVIVLPEQSLAEAMQVTERLRAAVERLAIATETERSVVTISAGIAELDPKADSTPQEWLRRADAALYRAKSAGRNRVETAAAPWR